MNTVLARRTGVREFDFGLDGERHAMGVLLGQLSERSLTQAGLLISVLVQYLTANDLSRSHSSGRCGRVFGKMFRGPLASL